MYDTLTQKLHMPNNDCVVNKIVYQVNCLMTWRSLHV